MVSLFSSLGSLGFKVVAGTTVLTAVVATTLSTTLNSSSKQEVEAIKAQFEDVSWDEEREHKIEDRQLLKKVAAQETPKYISDLARRFNRLLDVKSEDNILWWRTLKANKRTLDDATLGLFKNKCAEIFNTDLSKATEEFKKVSDEFVKINCRRPELSKEKFKKHGINYVSLAKSAAWNFEASKNVHFWKRVTDFAKAKNVKNVDRLSSYCTWFPKNNWTSNEDKFTTEERDFLRYCR